MEAVGEGSWGCTSSCAPCAWLGSRSGFLRGVLNWTWGQELGNLVVTGHTLAVPGSGCRGCGLASGLVAAEVVGQASVAMHLWLGHCLSVCPACQHESSRCQCTCPIG